MQRLAELVIFAGRRQRGPQAPPQVWRRLFHLIAGSSIPLAGIFAPDREFLAALAVLAVGAVVLDLSRFGVGPLNRVYMRCMAPLLKDEEVSRMTGATHMLVASCLVFWLFGKEVAVPVMFYLSLGDPVAAIVGRRMPGLRIKGKSPGGTVAFAITGSAVAAVLVLSGLWAITRPGAGAGIAAIVELAGIPPDDNLTIPLIAGAAMWAMGV